MPATRIMPGASSPQGVTAVEPVDTDPVNGNVVANTDSLLIAVDNTSGEAPVTFTFTTVATLGGYAVEDVVVTVAMGAHKVFGRFPSRVFSGDLHFTTDVAAPVSVQA